MTEPKIQFISNNLVRPIVLTGMMGSGKSHIGRLLAGQLGVNFYDSDSLIEERAGATIAEIFERDGEERFRQSEARVIEGLLAKQELCVIATGGGAVLNTDVFDLIKRHSMSVFLNVSEDLLFERVKGDTSRPLLQAENPRERLHDLLEARLPVYQQADLCFDVFDEEALAVVKRLVKELSDFIKHKEEG